MLKISNQELINEWIEAGNKREDFANRLFKSIEELECLLHQLLNEGELIIKWGGKLKNKGNAIITV